MKIKTRNLNRLIKDLSSREIDFFLYLIKRQDDIGLVNDVYSQDVMESLNMPRSTFYSALKNLEDKKFIHINWRNDTRGFDITIIDNAFLSRSDFKEGYVNVNLDFILSAEFVLLGVNIKKFFLRLLGLQANKKPVGLIKDTLKRYKVHNQMDILDKLFDILVDGNLIMFTIKSVLLKQSCSGEYLQYRNKIENYCEEYSLDYTDREMHDTTRSIINHTRKGRFALIQKALDAIRRIGRLQPKLINHICKISY